MRVLVLLGVLGGCGLGLDKSSAWVDDDGDGFPSFNDCDDGDEAVHPFAAEACDEIDNDCDGVVDEGEAEDAVVYYPDLDRDGYGDPRFPTPACTEPAGFVTDKNDCDDVDRDVNPDGTEVCDGADNDCDGYTDDEDAFLDDSTLSTFHKDADGDGYGLEATAVEACSAPAGFVSRTDEFDCDDSSALAHPGLTETCGDGLDNDCDGTSNDCGLSGAYALSSDSDAVLWGDQDSDAAGAAVSGLGDINGDGKGDFIVGAWYANTSAGTRSGAAYVVAGPVSGSKDLTSVGKELRAAHSSDYLGWAVGGRGDVDGDGYDDVLVGSPYEDGGGTDAGTAYLVDGPVDDGMEIYDADGIVKGTASSDNLGYAVAIVSDLDDDDDDDVVLGAYGNDDNGSSAGAVYIFSGPVDGTFNASSADGVLLGNTSSDYAGFDVSSAGDTDGDGNGDLVVGAHGNDDAGSSAGAAYMVRGPVAGTVGLSAADCVLQGPGSSYEAGRAVAGGGDVNGDGYADVLVSSVYDSSYRGVVWVIDGPMSGTLSLSGADATIQGASSSDYLGYGISNAGDVDGDRKDDILVGAMFGDSTTTDGGTAWLVLGPVTGTVEVSVDAAASFGGAASSDYVGWSVDIVPDTDGDHFADLLIGAYGNDTWGSNSGAAYLVLGSGI